MKDQNEKKGLFDRLTANKKTKKCSCCGSFVIEEIPGEDTGNKDEKEPKQGDSGSCCK